MQIDPEYDVILADPDRCAQCRRPLDNRSVSGTYCHLCEKEAATPPAGPAGQTEEDVANLAKRELAMRELCRRRFMPFIKRMYPTYQAAWFAHDLASRLERFVRRVERKESPRMMINVPPRRGKTEQASKLMPAWALGKHPEWTFIAATHTDTLAVDNSRDVISYINDDRYRAVFPDTKLDPDNKAASGWRTTKGGKYFPAGVGKGIAGRGAHILLIDDPHRDKDAYSEAIRAAVYRWYKSSARTRMMPGGGIILIQTRWTLDDLTGMILEQEGLLQDGGKWEQVLYPEEAMHDEYRLPNGVVVDHPAPDAIFLREKGECLDPDRYPPESNEEHKADKATWAALFQQDPTAEGAGTVDDDLLETCACLVSDLPPRSQLVFYVTWDTAVSQTEQSCNSAEVIGGLDTSGTLWIFSASQDKMGSLELSDQIIATFRDYHPEITGIEKTNHSVAVAPFLDRYVEDNNIYDLDIEYLDHGNKDKVMRAKPMQAMMKRGRVKIPVDAPWYKELKKELLRFPAKPNDLADAFFYQGQLLSIMSNPDRRSAKEKRRESWRDKVKASARKNNWRTA